MSSLARKILNTHAARTLGSTFFGLSLLLLILIISGVGTFYQYETAIEKIYNTPWFFALLMLLGINHAISALLTLVFHTLPMYHPRYRHRPAAYEALKHKFELRVPEGFGASRESLEEDKPIKVPLVGRLVEFLQDRNFTVHHRGHLLYAHRNLWGRFGGTITHVGLVIIIIGGMVQLTAGLSGQIQLLEGEGDGRIVYERGGRQVVRNLGYDLYLRDFDIGFYPNTNMPQRFISHVEVRDAGNNGLARGTTEVNNAFFYGDYTFHQNSYNEVNDVPRYHIDLVNSQTGERHTFQVTSQPAPMPTFYTIPQTSLVFALRETRDGLRWYLADDSQLIAKGEADQRRGGYTITVTRFAPDFRILEDGGIDTSGTSFNNPAVEIALKTGDRTIATQWLFLNADMQTFMRSPGGPFRFELEDLLMASNAAGKTSFTPDDVKALIRVFDVESDILLGQFEAGGGKTASFNITPSPNAADSGEANGNGQNQGWMVEHVEPVKAYVSILGVTTAPGKPIAYIGCVFLVLGMIIGFGIPRRQVWALYQPEQQVLLVGGQTRYYGARLRDEMLECLRFLSTAKNDTKSQE